MLNVIVGFLMFSASALVGIWLKNKYKEKSLFYKDYAAYVAHARKLISASRASVGEINASFYDSKSKAFSALLCGGEFRCNLPQGELDAAKKFIGDIGNSDADTTLDTLSAKEEELRRICMDVCPELDKKGAMLFKVFVLVGVALFIIFV